MTVNGYHDHLAHRLVADGTRAHRGALAVLAEAVREIAPGAAAALTDWDAPEVARLRAYGVAREAMRVAARDRLTRLRIEAELADTYVLTA